MSGGDGIEQAVAALHSNNGTVETEDDINAEHITPDQGKYYFYYLKNNNLSLCFKYFMKLSCKAYRIVP